MNVPPKKKKHDCVYHCGHDIEIDDRYRLNDMTVISRTNKFLFLDQSQKIKWVFVCILIYFEECHIEMENDDDGDDDNKWLCSSSSNSIRSSLSKVL